MPKQSSYDVGHTSHGQTPTRPQPKGGQGHRWPMQSAQHRMHFSQPHHVGHGRPFPLLPATVQRGRILYATPRQTCPQPRPRAQIAFKNSMIHGILQFTLSIAFRYVLHRNKSRDIRCRESFPCVTKISHPHEKWLKIQPNVQCVATSPLPPQDNRTP